MPWKLNSAHSNFFFGLRVPRRPRRVSRTIRRGLDGSRVIPPDCHENREILFGPGDFGRESALRQSLQLVGDSIGPIIVTDVPICPRHRCHTRQPAPTLLPRADRLGRTVEARRCGDGSRTTVRKVCAHAAYGAIRWTRVVVAQNVLNCRVECVRLAHGPGMHQPVAKRSGTEVVATQHSARAVSGIRANPDMYPEIDSAARSFRGRGNPGFSWRLGDRLRCQNERAKSFGVLVLSVQRCFWGYGPGTSIRRLRARHRVASRTSN